jgi:hypothetical protein
VLTDPQAVTIAATPITLPRIEERAETHVYSNRALGTTLYVTQKVSKDGNLRSSASLVKEQIYTDPISGLKSRLLPSVTVSSNQPLGVAATSAEELYDALTNALEASTKALLKKIFGGEK